MNKYVVYKVDFNDLQHWLNHIDTMYPGYHLYQVVPEHSYDGALAVIILERDKVEINNEN